MAAKTPKYRVMWKPGGGTRAHRLARNLSAFMRLRSFRREFCWQDEYPAWPYPTGIGCVVNVERPSTCFGRRDLEGFARA